MISVRRSLGLQQHIRLFHRLQTALSMHVPGMLSRPGDGGDGSAHEGGGNGSDLEGGGCGKRCDAFICVARWACNDVTGTGGSDSSSSSGSGSGSVRGCDFLTGGSVEISCTPFLLLLPNHPKPLLSVVLCPEEFADVCRRPLPVVLPDECDVVDDDRLVMSSSFALLALRAPTVSACCGGTSNVGNILKLHLWHRLGAWLVATCRATT